MFRNKELVEIFFEVNKKIDQLVQVNAQDKLGNTPLHLALNSGNKNMAEWLLSRGANLKLANEEELTPFHIMCKKSINHDIMEKWRTQVNNEISQWVEVNAQDQLGNTPLHYALNASCDTNFIELLLRNGANVNLANKQGLTPLHFTCQYLIQDSLRQLEIFFKVKNEFDQLVDFNAQDEFGNTPLHLALKSANLYENKTAIERLLKNGADANLGNEEGSTPLHIICSRKSYDDLVKLFFEVNDEIKQAIKVDARDKKGRTPLQLAVANLLPIVVVVLLHHGADLSSFIFPAESCFAEVLKRIPAEKICIFESRVASGALGVVEKLEKGGYELDRSDALTRS
ncbi:hypothetical protein TKK_0014985 [Trichogramma kaykai]